MTSREDPSRGLRRAETPFGVHLAMRWWVPVVLTATVIVCTYGLQLALGIGASRIEVDVLGKDPAEVTLTPLTYLATNLAIILMTPIVLLVLTVLARVPWESVLSSGRSFDWRQLGRWTAAFAVLMVVVNLIVQFLRPTPLGEFGLSGTTIALLAVVVLTTPLQAASEEVVFRGVLTAAYATWATATRPALVLGITLSTALFALLHTSFDVWMIIHYVGLGASTAVMAAIARGLEPAIAFHAMNNVFAMGIGALSSDGGGISQNREAGASGPYMLIFVAAEAAAVVLVWRRNRRST